jgi:Phospholipase_D-nuclease N-terminal
MPSTAANRQRCTTVHGTDHNSSAVNSGITRMKVHGRQVAKVCSGGTSQPITAGPSSVAQAMVRPVSPTTPTVPTSPIGQPSAINAVARHYCDDRARRTMLAPSSSDEGASDMTFTHLLIVLPILVLDVAAIVDVLRRDVDSGTKIGWIIADLCLPVVGPLAWFLFSRRSKAVRRASA